MSIIAFTVRCDRDGIEAEGGPGGLLPEGWTGLSLGGGAGVTPLAGHLCPTCSASLDGFMRESGSEVLVQGDQ